MPQLDKVTFLSQFFWLCFFYIGFYFLVLKFFLPKMSLILKIRKNKLSGSQDNVNDLTQENKKIYSNYEILFNSVLNTSKNTFNKSLHLIETWLHSTVESTEKQHFISLNNTYIRSVGDNSLKENLAFNVYAPENSKSTYVFCLLKIFRNKSKNSGNSKNIK